MKIAIDINELTLKNDTGVKIYTREIVGALGKIDRENEYVLYANCRNEAAPRSYGFDYNNFKLKTTKSQLPFWTYTKLPREIRKDKPDILFMPIQAVPFLNKPKDIKIVVTVHDLAFMVFPEYFTAKDRFLLNFHTKRAIQMADRIIAPSEATKKDIIKFYGITSPRPSLSGGEDKIRVIYHGMKARVSLRGRLARGNPVENTQDRNVTSDEIATGLPRSATAPLAMTFDDNPYILFVGQIQPRKNLIRLIEAFETIKTRRNEALPRSYNSLKLVIAGGKGWMAEKTYEKAKKSKFSKDIVFKGKVSDEDLAKLYRNALIFVLPSLYEGFGLPVLEAMSYGVPCAVSDNSSLTEIVDDHALLFNANSSDDIAEKISMLLLRDSLRDDFSKRSLENVKKFSWAESARRTLKIFEEVTNI